MKKFILRPVDEKDALLIHSWSYEDPYAVYNWTEAIDEAIHEMLDRRSPYYSVHDEQAKIIGFFCFGTSAQPWKNNEASLRTEYGIIDIGLGMRPDLTSKGYGLAFISAGISFAEECFAPEVIRLFVRHFNKRAINVYMQAGFVPIRLFSLRDIECPDDFLEMQLMREVPSLAYNRSDHTSSKLQQRS